MINRERVIRNLERTRRRLVKMAASAAIAFGVLSLAAVVRPIEAQQQAVRVPTSVLERYVGEYVYPKGNTILIRLRGDTLLQEAGNRLVILTPMSENLFRVGPGVFTAEFVIGQDGGVTQILTDGAGVEFRLPRKGTRAVAPAPPAPTVRVPRSVLERYVGVYEYIPGQMKRTDLRIEVYLRGDTLMREIGGPQILSPISETRFRVAGTSIMVEFVADDAGVTQVLGTGGQQMIARLKSKR